MVFPYRNTSFFFGSVKVCSSMATWDKKAASSKYLACFVHFRTQAWHLMQVPGTLHTSLGSMAPMGHSRAQAPQLVHRDGSVRGLAFRNLAGSPSVP